MIKHNKITSVLKDKKGLSLVLVLCVTLFLMAMCTSVLVAASSASSTESENWKYTQLSLYSDSTAKAFSFSMQDDELPADLANAAPKNLGAQIGSAIVMDHANEINGVALEAGEVRFLYTMKPIVKTTVASDLILKNLAISDISVNIVDKTVTLIDEDPGSPEIIDPGGGPTIPAIPPTKPGAMLSYAKAEVIYQVTADGKTVKTLLTYEIVDMEFELKTVGTSPKYVISDFKKWRLIGVEKLDS